MYKDKKWVDKLLDNLPYVKLAINSLVVDSESKIPFKLCYGLSVLTVTDHLDSMHHVE